MAKKHAAAPDGNEDDFITLAKHLRHVHDRGQDEFRAEIERLGLKQRRAYYLVEIDKAYDGLPIPPDQLRRVGWTKLHALAPLIDRSNCADLLSYAEGQTVKTVQEMAQTAAKRLGKHAMVFNLSESERERLSRALQQFGARETDHGLTGKEAALDALVRGYLAGEK